MSSLEPAYNKPPIPPTSPFNTPPALIAFTLGVLVVCFVAFSIVYLGKYCFSSIIHTWPFQRTASGSLVHLTPNRDSPKGLDPSLLQVFPTFLYSSVKNLRKEEYALECAICLLEFEDDDMLRLLTLCCHVFHQDCIDLWLSSHKTCPVCRRDLDTPTDNTQKTRDAVEEGVVSSITGEVHIDVKEGEEGESFEDKINKHEHDQDHVSTSTSMQQQDEQMFVRSHSTGHSIVMIRGCGEREDEKYTLRLPEHVIRGRHNSTRSCASIKDITGLVALCSNYGFVQPVPGNSSLIDAQKA
ncbi:hypothetical protein RJT34_02257 [Clitoria ternatea]|uniref:RING-type E3 ubiquitin transferase n=1 Tax=Clitoria ternatea TaxID=43366 RepID=A0AAN9Q3T5_CLITE